MGIRRVVTGHDANGKAVFASDEEVEPIRLALLPGAEFYRLWGSDQPCRFPDDGSAPADHTYFPPVGGFRFGLFTVPPDSSMIQNLDSEAVIRELNEKLPGLGEHLEPDHPGMHRTATIDYEFIASGRCVLELDDGAKRALGPGDTVIQNGTRHAWRNPYHEPCVIVVVLIGAHHDDAPNRRTESDFESYAHRLETEISRLPLGWVHRNASGRVSELRIPVQLNLPAPSAELEYCLHDAFTKARKARHEFVSVEHLLLAILGTPTALEILGGRGCDVVNLDQKLKEYLDQSVPQKDQGWKGEVHATTGVQRVLERAAFQAQSSGEGEVRVKSIIESILNEKQSYAVSLLNQRG